MSWKGALSTRMPRPSRRAGWALGIFAALVALAILLSFVLNEPLRRSIERQMNASLDGYTVSINKLRFHPIGLSLTLLDLVFVQQANPDAPLATIPRLDASVQWKALLSASLVADFAMDQPKLHVNVTHLREEAADPQPVTQKGWQEDVYNPEQDREKGFGRKVYEKVVEGVSKILKNRPRKEVATVATISGPVAKADTNAFEVIVKLIQNAFFEAIPSWLRPGSRGPARSWPPR